MSITAAGQAAIYTKETAGLRSEENSRELQTRHCEAFCKTHEPVIIAHYHDPAGIRHDFEWMMGEAALDEPPFQYIVVYKLRNFSWSLDETVLCRDKLRTSGVLLVSTAESSPWPAPLSTAASPARPATTCTVKQNAVYNEHVTT